VPRVGPRRKEGNEKDFWPKGGDREFSIYDKNLKMGSKGRFKKNSKGN
jgi:hypothetical protein